MLHVLWESEPMARPSARTCFGPLMASAIMARSRPPPPEYLRQPVLRSIRTHERF